MKAVNAMSNDELENQQIILRKDIADIKSQIDEHNLISKHLGEDQILDEEWLRKAKYTLRAKGHRHQLVCKEIGVRNRKAKESRRKFSDFFLQVAKSNMDAIDFSVLEEKALSVMSEYAESNPTQGIIKVDY